MANTSIKLNAGYIGETIEEKVNRIANNKEPIKDGAPLTYTDRSDGVLPEMNIRTDRFDIALDAADAITKTHRGKREERVKLEKEKKNPGKTGDGGPESIQATK